MITDIAFTRFRGFQRFKADLSPNAYIVGPNSAGKSTILEAVVLGEQCLQLARRKSPPTRAMHRGQQWKAYPLHAGLEGDEDPIRFDFGSDETCASIGWNRDGTVHMVWPAESDDSERGFFYLELTEGAQPRHLEQVRDVFPPITVVPVVTPLSRVEELRDSKYIRSQINTRLASRHFRNHAWAMEQKGEWLRFKEFCSPWLPEIELLDADLDAGQNRLTIFYSESGSRVPKELAWAGDGLQIWVQLLWHVFRAEGSDTVVLDEPEVYLHPDLQRRLVRLLNTLDTQVILASHSAEVIAEAPDGAVLWVDRRQDRARRVAGGRTLSALSDALGYSFNLALAASMRSQLVLGTDCDDIRVLRSIARQLGAINIANEHAVNVVRLRELSHWSDRSSLGEVLRRVLPDGIATALLLGAGLRSSAVNRVFESELVATGIEVHFWALPELENYLLDADAIARVSGAAPEVVAIRITESFEALCLSSRSSHSAEWLAAASGEDSMLVVGKAEAEFDRTWELGYGRETLVRGSRVFAELNLWLDADGYRTVTPNAVARAVRPQALAPELFNALMSLDARIS